jgi:hypothetical protein
LQISFSINMVSAGGLALGREIRLGALDFIADDSAWLQEAPLDVEALPIRRVAHFHASACGVLLRQPSTQYRSAPVASSLPAVRRRKRSGRSRLQRWVKHAVACQSTTPQVAVIEPDESLYGLFDLPAGHSDSLFECKSNDPAAEVLMVDSHRNPPGFRRGGGGSGSPSLDHDEYIPEALTAEQREELHRRNVQALRPPSLGSPLRLGLWRLRA